MKKVLALALSVVTALSMTACGGGSAKPKDPKEVYSTAVKKNAELKSMDMATKMNMKITMGEQSMDMDMEMNVKMDQINTDKMKYYAETKTTSQGESMDMTIFYTDGYYYMDAMGQKIKYQMDLAQMMEQVEQSSMGEEIDVAWMKDLTLKEDGDNQVLTFTADPEKMDSYVQEYMSSLGTTAGMEDMEMTIKSVTGEYVINKDGYYTAMKMTMDIDVSAQGQTMNMVMDMDATVNNPGKEVTVTIPSTDGFEEVSPEAMQQAA